MNESNFKLLGNFASVDFYLCEGKDITLISENNAYNMKFLVQEALNLYVPNALVIIDLVDCKINPNAVRTKKISFL